MDLNEELAARGYAREVNEVGGVTYEMGVSGGRVVRVEASPNCNAFSVRVVAQKGGITPISYFQRKDGNAVEREVLDMAVACEAWAVPEGGESPLTAADMVCQIVFEHVGQTEADLAAAVFSAYDDETGRNDARDHWQDQGPDFVMDYLLMERFLLSGCDDLSREEWKRKVYLDPREEWESSPMEGLNL